MTAPDWRAETIVLAVAALDAAEALVRGDVLPAKTTGGRAVMAVPVESFNALRAALVALRGERT
jgi:hypothetical protein